MKIFVFAAVAACLAAPTAGFAEEAQIVVSPAPVQEWVATTSRALENALLREDTMRARAGISVVHFTTSPEGRPVNIKTISSAGYNDLHRVARRAVHRLRLQPIAADIPRNQVYEAVIVLGETPEQLAQLRSHAIAHATEENARWAAKGLPNPVISVAIAGF